jgi:diguanylate cyclase (GGDEF)-like protein
MNNPSGKRPQDPVLSTPEPPGPFERFFARILGMPTGAQIAIALLVQVLVVTLDVLLPEDLHPGFLYVPAIIIVTWAVGAGGGILFAVVSACAEQVFFAPPRASETLGIANTALSAMTLITIALLVNRLKAHFMGESRLARSDYLTGLPNAKAFRERIESEIVRNRRYGQSFAVAYLDCDDFGALNRQHGRRRGDDLLKLVGDTLQHSVRMSDMVARTGGDQFMVLLTGCDNISAQVAARKIQKALQKAIAATGVPLGITIGCAVFMTPPDTADQLMEHADELMAQVKRVQRGDLTIEESVTEPPTPEESSEPVHR